MVKTQKDAGKRVRLTVISMVLLAGVFVFAFAAGAFVYATGRAVIMEPVMQMVSHTEYRFGEPGQIIARLVDFQGDPVVVTNCYATILNPDKTYFVNHSLMQNVSLISGDHYYNFTTPEGPEGTYEYQAVCNYGVGKTAMVTNSFHLSSALGNIMANQTAQNLQLIAIQGDLTVLNTSLTNLQTSVNDLNVSMGTQFGDLTSQLNANITSVLNHTGTIINEITNLNQTVYNLHNDTLNQFSYMNQTIHAAKNEIKNDIDNLYNMTYNMNYTVNQIYGAVTGGNLSVNLTPVFTALNALNTSLQAVIASNFTYTNSLITTLESNMAANFSVVTNNQAAMTVTLNDVNSTVNSISSLLSTVDTTTQNTYTYVTTTLAGKVDDVLSGMGVINATVNRIETYSSEINATTAQILQNQQEQVVMTVTSG